LIDFGLIRLFLNWFLNLFLDLADRRSALNAMNPVAVPRIRIPAVIQAMPVDVAVRKPLARFSHAEA
jgi:hypothetical protein